MNFRLLLLLFVLVKCEDDFSTSITMPDNETVVQMKFIVKNDNKDVKIDKENLGVSSILKIYIIIWFSFRKFLKF